MRSGSLHYSRVPRAYWRDRLQRLQALGLNSVTTYVPWNFHETVEGDFDFDGQRDVGAFLDLADELGLVVVLRMGPYMCGEWDFGGFPSWLMAKENMTLRTWNGPYISAVDAWWAALLPLVKPRLYAAGGAVAMIQLENEYGDYGDCAANPDDAKYMNHLYDLAVAALGDDVVYTTVSPARNLMKGSPWQNDSRVVATVDGPLADSYHADFVAQRAFNAPGNSPKMWTELWTGWFTHWLDAQAANKTAKEYGSGVGAMAAEPNASFSLYMAHGGTSYGFWSGANILDGVYVADVTSYDYNAPIGEAGDHTIGADGGDTFAAIRDAIAAVYGAPPAEPPALPKVAYGAISLNASAALFDQVEALATCSVRANASAWPTQEALGQAHGFTLFTVRGDLPAALEFAPETLHDRVQVFVDGAAAGVAFRGTCAPNCSVPLPAGGRLDLLLENTGRVNYGNPDLYDPKGFLGPPPVAAAADVRCLALDDAPARVAFGPVAADAGAPTFLRGHFDIADTPADTYVDTRGLSKGLLWVNGALLGRFWEAAGPQHALYAPAPFLRSGSNEVVILDLEGSAPDAIASVARQRWTA